MDLVAICTNLGTICTNLGSNCANLGEVWTDLAWICAGLGGNLHGPWFVLYTPCGTVAHALLVTSRTRNWMKSTLWLATSALCLWLAGRVVAGEILVFAAASLTDSLKEIAASYEASTGETVRFNFAASNVLAMQIQAGAPADIFFSADEAKMEALDRGGFIAHETRKDLLGNLLVIITAAGGPKISAAEDLRQPAVRHLSLGDPAAVPAGIYAQAWLEKAGLWQVLLPKVVPAENVRAAMAVVESGNAEAGIVYKTDAAISKKVNVALEIPAADCPKITYPAAVIQDSRHAEAARRFLVYLAGERAGETFVKFGFVIRREK